jgi:hypothetical protein
MDYTKIAAESKKNFQQDLKSADSKGNALKGKK